MTVMAITPVRMINLVAPLPHEGTAMRITETSGSAPERSGAVTWSSDRPGDVDSATSTPPTRGMPGIRTSTTATRTTTTSTTSAAPEPSADDPRHPAEFSFTDLVEAYLDCRRTKRNSASALTFEQRLEYNLATLHDELTSGAYRPGPSICFIITRPKVREVWAAAFRDRIVHHLLYRKIGPRFEAGFVADSCACIPERGTLYAARRLEGKVRSQTQNWSRPGYYLKLDLANFFVSIDKRIAAEQLTRRISEPWWRQLALDILFHDPRQNVVVQGRPDEFARVPAHKSLFNQDAHHGLPIGNLSSQFFANVLLDALDQHIKHNLKARHYIRYVDDMVLLHESADWLNQANADIEAWLPAHLQLAINPRKTILQPIDRGIDFVGQVIRPWHRTLRRRTYHDALRRVATIPAEDLFHTANSYFGLLRQTTHSHVDRARLANLLRDRGHTICGDFTKTYRRSL
jgi:retron-type reverse transcriptase